MIRTKTLSAREYTHVIWIAYNFFKHENLCIFLKKPMFVITS
jgi:hypothetical protein